MTSSRIENAGPMAKGDGHWLVSEHYALLLTPAGTGLSAFDECLLTVFRADPAEAPGGFAIYLRDLETQQYWTACGQALPGQQIGNVSAGDGRISVERQHAQLESRVDVELRGAAEVRTCRLTNRGTSARR